jgi:hypothetical protein
LSQSTFPKPDHIVICILENHSFNQIIGSPAAPYINALANDTLSALFTSSYGVTHPSQPNYLAIFSGDTQGVTDDLVPTGNPFNTPNLGEQLIGIGNTFISYSDDLPSVGFDGELSDNYARRHNPMTNWMGNGTNQISPSSNQPYNAFPTTDFTTLPTVCFVNPTTVDDMHDGPDPVAISNGDAWISTNLDQYVQWAKINNSLFILTFDEDNDSSSNHITTIFTGQKVLSGHYDSIINHYSILHTIEKMYGLTYIGDSITFPPITYCWKSNPNSIPYLIDNSSKAIIYPNPARGFIDVKLSNYQNAQVEIYNLNGEIIAVHPLLTNITEINTGGLRTGYYLMKIKSNEEVIVKRFIKN